MNDIPFEDILSIVKAHSVLFNKYHLDKHKVLEEIFKDTPDKKIISSLDELK